MTYPFESLNSIEWTQLKDTLREFAHKEIMPRFNQVTAQTKDDGSLLTEADTSMQDAVEAYLANRYPQYAFLGEEKTPAEQTAALASAQGCWILDPLDGTSNFASGIPFFCTSLCLVIDGQVKAGLVYDPNRDEMFTARQSLGAELNDAPLIAQTHKLHLKQCIAIADLKRLPFAWGTQLATAPPFASQRSFGSVALDWCWIAAGRGQVYVHGAQNIWDYGAGWLILNEAGGESETFDGKNVMVASVQKRSAIAGTTPALFHEWRETLKSTT